MLSWPPNMRPLHLALALCTSLAACTASDGGDDPSPDASRGWRATNLVVADGQDEWNGEVDASGQLTFDLSCPDGGAYHLEGSYSNENDYALTLSFDDCTSEGVTIAGHLALEASISVTPTTSHVAVDYSGELTFSGDANGSCAIDMTAEITADSSGGGSAEVEYHGSVCGFSADAVVSASGA
ncbi:MAG: hypothetical protein IPN32_11380 [Deltaproteobacteria bacterium]|nr:hypothetical protein [Deltaproteobacteria bacterium]